MTKLRLLEYVGIIAVTVLIAGAIIQLKSPDEKAFNTERPQPTIHFTLNEARAYQTAWNTDNRLTGMGKLEILKYDQPDEHFPTIIIKPEKQFQEIEGFGGALTDASAETFYKMPADKQEEFMKAYFDPDKGIGYSLCRTQINSCDFSSESYAYSEVAGDVNLDHFTIEHDLKYRIPFIREAIKYSSGNLKLFASPWSPPAWMKTNNNMLQGGTLQPEYFQTWANYYVKFFNAYANEGIPFWGLTVQNEPMAVQRWESCIYTAEEERDFIKNFLGPTLTKNNMADLNIIIYDHNRGVITQRAGTILDDPEASKYVWGTGFHWYSGDHFDNIRQVNEAYPDKKLLFTEGCVFPFDYGNLADWQYGERYGESIIYDLNNSAAGWVDWNVLLDETGGPNHVANFCYAPVIGNTSSGELVYMNSYYYLGHFSKFIRPGARRVLCSSNSDDLQATAFLNTDESLAVVVMNQTEANIDFKVWLAGMGIPVSLPSHAITTMILQ
ncbi:MAG TPA: glycoside hydrolase family 30 protein [Bacteroidales bacterium]|nr:glycoside hydrolase family 30 protein [Bacteroidales bacterium]